MTPTRGRSPIGTRCVGHTPYGHWKTTTVVCALRCDGLVAPWVIDGPINGQTFRIWVEEVLVPVLHPGDIVVLDNLGSHKVTGIEEAMTAFETATFPTMKIAGLGGAPASTTLIRTWMAKGIPFQPAYGMTEIGPAITIMNEERLQEKVGSSGQPVMNLELRIVTTDGQDAKTGEIGEIWVKGPVLLSGYWNLPDESAKALSEGWFRTGDAAWMDEEGYVFIVDRYKDMYISGGENVYPTEVENVLCAYKDVLAAAVVGIADDRWGEVGCAFIVPRAGRTIDQQALMEHCRQNLAKYKLPKVVRIVDTLPRTASGKVLKGELRQAAAGMSAATGQ